MFKVALNKIYISRGDDARFTISLNKIDDIPQEYELSDKDDVYFIVTDRPKIVSISELDTPESCIFYKKGLSIHLTLTDTENLDEGTYYYHVRVVLNESGDVNTIIEPEDFVVTPTSESW